VTVTKLPTATTVLTVFAQTMRDTVVKLVLQTTNAIKTVIVLPVLVVIVLLLVEVFALDQTNAVPLLTIHANSAKLVSALLVVATLLALSKLIVPVTETVPFAQEVFAHLFVMDLASLTLIVEDNSMDADHVSMVSVFPVSVVLPVFKVTTTLVPDLMIVLSAIHLPIPLIPVLPDYLAVLLVM